ncbi:MAG: GGDEF domain-containing protein [Frankiaceae bacterium]|nr:GGDEF domain-containing protein [Frankiaceae bacterium]
MSAPDLPDGLLAQLVECAPDGILAVDDEGSILLVNQQVELMLGYRREELINQPVEMLLPDRFRAAHAGYRREFAASPAVRPMGGGGRLRARRKDGTELDVEISLAPLRIGSRTIVGAVIRDITDRAHALADLEHRALHDPLTGLPNRALLMDRLRTALSRQERAGGGTGVLFLDVDHLKAVNDSLGHAAGDALLTSVSERIGAVLRPADTLARLGGDEFVVLTEQVPAMPELCELSERVLTAVRVPLDHAGHDLHPSVSIGVAFARPGRSDADQLLRDADAAMYRAKRARRGSFALAHTSDPDPSVGGSGLTG